MKYTLIILFTFLSTAMLAQKNLEDLLKQYNDKGIPYISVEELAMPKTNAILLDTREPKEYEVSHLKDAVSVGYDHFDIASVEKQYPNKDEKIVVYCSLGIRSETVGKKLKEAGYTNVYNLYGGIFEWKNKDFSVIDSEEKETEKIHTFNKEWSKWLEKGEKIYEETPKKKKKKNKSN
ncbi:rhodanese-like domain-containing protein [Oceanihabitans sp. 2_MG-2023]|uniref:rhodanese-like domain-containing protein n=1 Tax=Oceanihabitans sp. 2_MG-2023 TaxID=3062661 RepID=UPI0026E38901|nr:rhodanese-like domain-containing protein [Oceanihabitans sp. 2_MG-2023]MDO6595390.1 rhodanese-like domain-containing protein [Oceanihabitans sp. 2_MG-2023]